MNPFPGVEALANLLLRQTLEASVLIALVLMVQFLFRKQLVARWRFALWWLVLAALLLPVRPASSFSIFNYLHADFSIHGPRYVVLPVATTPEAVVIPSHEPGRGVVPDNPRIRSTGDDQVSVTTLPATPAAQMKRLGDGPPRSFMSRHRGVAGREMDTDDLLMSGKLGAWLAGVLGLSAYVGRMVFKFRRQLSRQGAPVSAEVQSAFDECRQQMRARRKVELWETDAVKSPALYGFFRLQLLLPKGMGATFNQAELRHIFLHELAHVKRGDMWLNWLVTGLQIIHWFNPVIWFAFTRLRADRELACDELALIHSGEAQSQSYGQTVLKLLENLSQIKPPPGLVGIVEDRRQMAKRLQMIAAFRLPSKWSKLAAVLLLGLGLIGLTKAQTPSTPEQSGEKSPHVAQPVLNTNEVAKLRVLVLDGESSTPLPDARVSTGKTSVPTGKDGAALIPRPAVSDTAFMYEVDVKHSGYVGRLIKWSSFQQDRRAEVPDRYTVRLDKGRTIGGYVRDEKGNGIAGASIEIRGPSIANIPPREYPLINSTRPQNVKTDTNGFWLFDQAPVNLGDLGFTLIHPNYLRAYFRVKRNDDPDGLAKVRMVDFAATNAVMVLKAGKEISGQIVDKAGDPIRDVKVTLNREWSRPQSTFTNAADGSFVIWNGMVPEFVSGLPPESMILTFQKEGYASKSQVVALDTAPNQVRVVMQPGRTLRGLVVNSAGQPVTNAHFRVDNLNHGPADYSFYTNSDSQGRIVWFSAPEEPVTAMVGASGYLPQHVTNWLTDGVERKVVLLPLLKHDGPRVIKGRVLDAVTKQAITNFLVQWSGSLTPLEFRSEEGNYRIPFLERVKWATVVFSASGYEAQSLQLSGPQLIQEHDMLLQPGEDYHGAVWLPDGAPAAGASIVFATRQEAPYLGLKQFIVTGRAFSTETDQNGTFTHVQVGGCYAIAAVHEQGFAMIDIGQFVKDPNVKLEPWGRVEGTLRISGQAAAGQELILRPLSGGPLAMQPYLIGSNFKAVTDEVGRFSFEDVPPGEFKIYRSVLTFPPNLVSNVLNQMRDVNIGPKTLPVTSSYSHGVLLKVEPAKTTTVMSAGQGVNVRGRVLPVNGGAAFDWDNTRLTVKLVQDPVVWPWTKEKRRPDRAEMDRYFRSEEYKAATREQKIFVFAVNEDGTVQTTDVPPGTYQLECVAQVSPLPRVAAALKREIVIPKIPAGQSQVFDLGVLALSPGAKK